MRNRAPVWSKPKKAASAFLSAGAPRAEPAGCLRAARVVLAPHPARPSAVSRPCVASASRAPHDRPSSEFWQEFQLMRRSAQKRTQPLQGAREIRTALTRGFFGRARAVAAKRTRDGSDRGKNFNLCAHKLKFLPKSGAETAGRRPPRICCGDLPYVGSLSGVMETIVRLPFVAVASSLVGRFALPAAQGVAHTSGTARSPQPRAGEPERHAPMRTQPVLKSAPRVWAARRGSSRRQRPSAGNGSVPCESDAAPHRPEAPPPGRGSVPCLEPYEAPLRRVRYLSSSSCVFDAHAAAAERAT